MHQLHLLCVSHFQLAVRRHNTFIPETPARSISIFKPKCPKITGCALCVGDAWRGGRANQTPPKLPPPKPVCVAEPPCSNLPSPLHRPPNVGYLLGIVFFRCAVACSFIHLSVTLLRDLNKDGQRQRKSRLPFPNPIAHAAPGSKSRVVRRLLVRKGDCAALNQRYVRDLIASRPPAPAITRPFPGCNDKPRFPSA